MLIDFGKENIVDSFIYEIKYGTKENASKYLSDCVKTVNYEALKNALNTELNVNYLKPFYYDKSKRVHSVLIINMDKQNEILHFYLRKEKDEVSEHKIYKIEKE